MSNDDPTLDELYEDYCQSLEEYLSEHDYECDQCNDDIKSAKKIRNQLKHEVKNGD